MGRGAIQRQRGHERLSATANELFIDTPAVSRVNHSIERVSRASCQATLHCCVVRRQRRDQAALYYMHGSRNGQSHGQIAQWAKPRTDRAMVKAMDRSRNGQSHGQIAQRADPWTDRAMGKAMDRSRNGQSHGQIAQWAKPWTDRAMGKAMDRSRNGQSPE